MKFKKVLIANRGEIAVRVVRSCKELNIATVSVHSTADESSLHVKLADESVCIGPAKSSQSYLNIPAILSAAEITEADAVHPGFGFLSENREFAKMCEKWGITFIGPNLEAIEQMGDKILSKKIAEKAGLPVLKPILVNTRTDDQITNDAKTMGFPVLVKASAGGGGRGMKRVDDIDDLIPTIRRLKTEALAGFGDDTLFIEKYIVNPRHVEVQILGDKHGNVIHLGERDCTIQRRFQKLIEESPCPVISDQKRNEVCEAAVNLAKHVNYDSVGTVEFLYDQDEDKFYFMEMNTRIQVEHPVTEERTGLDLISWQIRVAQGEKLTIKQKDVSFRGHTMECRINAEDPETSLPSPGQIDHYHRPAGIGVRIDDFIYSGYKVPPFYDSMLAKIIVSAPTRNECLARMNRALNEMVIEGIKTNKKLHLSIINHPDFVGNNYATHFLATKFK
ncbi:MAG: acetyl-CoA carboxylase biotin carboxylase subunit [Bdellovibrionales bacterium CG12_big_fil_rev_8_21_14_0_65_38_15]|nr:MAG: acetyl-CoA carboxylase biotin carboxylase subunit [Bdellovibrionales bacterium CG22_combo_CG10-13_8_21_14_all_38_13]PIQ57364.1 MAG: acetyl-CoA carboxylase biotin carboxylase subunit [Bdellovibrionales bacterium CG12_big_fil_rev_8_21_14_0_65_38_15]PIR28909.1 MAG: acetyl-CoA carboxylase biotin carboxylase subunit [Bdellovibrionales bacterium CG11_big_fil_rev_8_21_14_0_20_38_13]